MSGYEDPPFRFSREELEARSREADRRESFPRWAEVAMQAMKRCLDSQSQEAQVTKALFCYSHGLIEESSERLSFSFRIHMAEFMAYQNVMTSQIIDKLVRGLQDDPRFKKRLLEMVVRREPDCIRFTVSTRT